MVKLARPDPGTNRPARNARPGASGCRGSPARSTAGPSTCRSGLLFCPGCPGTSRPAGSEATVDATAPTTPLPSPCPCGGERLLYREPGSRPCSSASTAPAGSPRTPTRRTDRWRRRRRRRRVSRTTSRADAPAEVRTPSGRAWPTGSRTARTPRAVRPRPGDAAPGTARQRRPVRRGGPDRRLVHRGLHREYCGRTAKGTSLEPDPDRPAALLLVGSSRTSSRSRPTRRWGRCCWCWGITWR